MNPMNPQPPGQGAPLRSYTCPWCGTVSDGTNLTCPACGAPVNVQAIVTKSGWAELPGIKDMAKLQFGQSYCQIEGTYVPVADLNLAGGDGIYFNHHILLWKDESVVMNRMSMSGGWKRMMAGLPLIMLEAHGPGHIAFSKDAPGELIALPLHPGQGVDVREHIFMLATNHVAYDWFNSSIWYTTQSGNDQETHYPLGMFLDRFQAPQTPGLLLLHGSGNVFVRHLAQGETVMVKPTALLFKDSTVGMHLHIDYPANYSLGGWWSTWYQRYLWLQLRGPGRVAVQSAYKHMEDNGNRIVNSSPASMSGW